MLDKVTLKADLKVLFNQLKTEENQDAAIDKLAGGIADAVDKYTKTATIIATPLEVSTAVMQAGPYPVAATNNLVSKIS